MMTKTKKVKDVPDLVKDKEDLKKKNSFLKRLADPKVGQSIDYCVRRISELGSLHTIKYELRASGLTDKQADIAIEAARYFTTLDEDWTNEVLVAIKTGVGDTIRQLNQMIENAENDKEKREIIAMRLKAYEAIRRILPEKVDLTIEEKESVENVIFDVYNVSDE